MNITIRTGQTHDIPSILHLIRELAAYEKAPLEVEVTEAEMLDWGFGPGKIFDFFVAEEEGRIIGLALY